VREAVLPAIAEAASLTEESYREGRADILRLLEAQHAVIDARLSALEATVAFCVALADLERAAGGDLYGAGGTR
jgi:outer membrane protein TolC